MARYELPRPRSRKRALRITLFVVVLLALLGARTIASTVIDYQWWKELGQVDTWLSLYLYGIGPLAAATALSFSALWITHARALKFAGTSLGEHSAYGKLSTFALLARTLPFSPPAPSHSLMLPPHSPRPFPLL